jgi:hypothetical protein
MSDITDCVVAVMIKMCILKWKKYLILLKRIQRNFHDIQNNAL